MCNVQVQISRRQAPNIADPRAYLTFVSILHSELEAAAGALVTLAKNSLADRASPVHGENCTTMRDICLSCIVLETMNCNERWERTCRAEVPPWQTQ